MGTLKKHVLVVHGSIKDFKCDFCSKSFGTNVNLQRHLETKGVSNHLQRIYDSKDQNMCNLCNTKFTCKGSLTKHELLIHGGIHFKCNFCGKELSSPRNLRRHVLAVHEMKKNFKCNFCGKSFSRKGSLERHTQNIHNNIGNKHFKCKLC